MLSNHLKSPQQAMPHYRPDRRAQQPALDWPVARTSLDTLIDLDMSDELIAQYFRVEPDDVVALRLDYGL